MKYTLIISFFIYCAVIIWLMAGYYRALKSHNNSFSKKYKNDLYHTFSILIAARNEANNLNQLLESLMEQDISWENGEIVLVLDRCQDESESIAREYLSRMPYLKLIIKSDQPTGNSPKKEALLAGLAQAKGEIIIQTDADSVLPFGWIRSHLNAYQSEQTASAFGLFRFKTEQTLWGNWLQSEKIWAFFIAIASNGWGIPFLAFGINLSHNINKTSLSVLLKKSNRSISGDDDLIIQSLPGKSRLASFIWDFRHLPETTLPATLREFLTQRKRHLSAGAYYSIPAKLFYGLYIFSWTLFIITIGFLPHYFPLFILKIVLDYFSIVFFAKTFLPEWGIFHLIIFEILYLPYVWITGVLSRIQPISWK